MAKRADTAVFTLNVGNTHCRLMEWSSRGSPTVNQKSWPTQENLRPNFDTFCFHPSKPVVVGGVVPDVKEKIVKFLRKAEIPVQLFRSDLKPRIKILPIPPERVGDDRIASALGAVALDHSHPWVIVDAGTAMTVNAVSPGAKGGIPKFQGGLIVPGGAMSLKALSHFTAQLPDLSSVKYKPKNSFIGRNTEEAMLLGVYRASVATAIALAKGQLEELGPRARIALTGGGSNSPEFQKVFRKAFPPSVVLIQPYLVDLGLFSCWKATSHT